MYSKLAVSALAVVSLGCSQVAHAAGNPGDRSAVLETVLHHSVQSAPQQHAAEASLRRAAQAKVSTQQAIALVANQTRGKVVQASFTMDGSTPAYTVRAVTGTCVWQGQVDAENGAILDSATTALRQRTLKPSDKAAVELAQRTSLPIERAVSLAERSTGGHVLDALLEEAGGRPQYEMQVVSRNAVQNVVVDPAAGTVRRAG